MSYKNIIMYSRVIPSHEKKGKKKENQDGMSFGDFITTMKSIEGK